MQAMLKSKTVQLKLENSAQKTTWFSPAKLFTKPYCTENEKLVFKNLASLRESD
jgi:hypothetical protein